MARSRTISRLDELRAEAATCTRCPLHLLGTQTVFGEGPPDASVVFVGEQPGDKEDLAGRPFVGPAGALLDRALEEAGIDRDLVYITNAVKHFKWTPRGKRRIHAKPDLSEIAACRVWLDAELSELAPKVVVCLGATAAQSLISKTFKVTKQRGEMLPWPPDSLITATVHPSSILRSPDDVSRASAFDGLVTDLRKVAAHLG